MSGAHATRKLNRDDVDIRNIELGSLRMKQVVVQKIGDTVVQNVQATGEFGIRVVLEVNNRILKNPLDFDQMKIILDHADAFYAEELMGILNGNPT